MTRIFNISFVYNELQYHALIDVRNTDDFKEYHITAMDDSLSYYLHSLKNHFKTTWPIDFS